MRIDLTALVADYPSIKALAFDASGERLAVGGAMNVLVYAVHGASAGARQPKLLGQLEVNDEEDQRGAGGPAIVDRVAFPGDAQTLLVALTEHSGTVGFSAQRRFDIASGALLACTYRRLNSDGTKLFPRPPEPPPAEPPSEVDQHTAERVWASADGAIEIWADESGSLVRRSAGGGAAEVLRTDEEGPIDGLVVHAVSPDGSLCARATSDFEAGTAALELFRLTDAKKPRRRRAATTPSPQPEKAAAKSALSPLLEAASLPAPHRPDMPLLLAEALLAHGETGQKLLAELLSKWQEQGSDELVESWQARASGPQRRGAEVSQDVDRRYAQAWASGLAGQAQPALEQLVEILSAEAGYHRERARRTMVALFEQIGTQADLVREYRGRMQIYL